MIKELKQRHLSGENLAKIQLKASNKSLDIACSYDVCDGYLLLLRSESCARAKQ